MEIADKLLSKGVCFTNGTYVTARQILKFGYPTDGLLNIYKGGGEPLRFTANDIVIPIPVLEEEWFYGPQLRVKNIQEKLKKIRNKEIETLTGKIEMIEKGETNIKTVLQGIAEEKITLPEGYSIEGIKLAVDEGDISITAFELQRQLGVLQSDKKLFDEHIKPETIDDILSIDAKKIADQWRYKTPKLEPRKV